MPNIDELLKSNKKKFKKSNVRPWDYLEQTEAQAINSSTTADYKLVAEKVAANTQGSAVLISVSEKGEATSSQDNHVDYSVSEERSDIHTRHQRRAKKSVDKQTRSVNSISFSITTLYGQQKRFFDFVLKKCIASNSLETGVLIRAELLSAIECTSVNALNTVIARLSEKGLLSRVPGKRGPGGFFCFAVTQDVLKEVKRLNWENE